MEMISGQAIIIFWYFSRYHQRSLRPISHPHTIPLPPSPAWLLPLLCLALFLYYIFSPLACSSLQYAFRGCSIRLSGRCQLVLAAMRCLRAVAISLIWYYQGLDRHLKYMPSSPIYIDNDASGAKSRARRSFPLPSADKLLLWVVIFYFSTVW